MKERKILTKLGIIFGIIDLLLILFGVIFLKPKQVLAETPDSFLMNELYLFNRDTFNLNPNFENGYLMKTTILPTDINSDNTSGLFGWYQSLGYRNLILPYYGSDNDNVYVVLGVPLNGITASSFQLAYDVSTPTLLDFYLIFSDGTYEEWDTEQNGFGAQFLGVSPSNRTKNCYAFCWEAYSPDYVPSFRFLGVTEGYEIGYQNGEITGFDRGWQVGYNAGHSRGYQEGITSDEVIYSDIQLFNQAIRNGNFNTNEYWTGINSTLTISNRAANLNKSSDDIDWGLRQDNLPEFAQTDILFVKFDIEVENSTTVRIRHPFTSEFLQLEGGVPSTCYLYKTSQTVISTNTLFFIQFERSNQTNTAKIDNVNLINLTTMYGAGNEPTYSECLNIFNADYYEYTNGTAVNMEYYTGYYAGKDDGIAEGINIGESNQINMGWIQEIFRAIQTFFNIQIFPHVTLGIIVGIPFVISLAWFVIKMFRGGGGGED